MKGREGHPVRKSSRGLGAEYKGGYKKYNALLKKGTQHPMKSGGRFARIDAGMKKRSVKACRRLIRPVKSARSRRN